MIETSRQVGHHNRSVMSPDSENGGMMTPGATTAGGSSHSKMSGDSEASNQNDEADESPEPMEGNVCFTEELAAIKEDQTTLIKVASDGFEACANRDDLFDEYLDGLVLEADNASDTVARNIRHMQAQISDILNDSGEPEEL